MIPKQNFQNALDLINKSANVLITTHTKVDGDAAGSSLAMKEALSTLGKKAQLLFLSPLPQWYAFLFDNKVPVLGRDITPEQLSAGPALRSDVSSVAQAKEEAQKEDLGHFDLIVILDTNSYSQLPEFEDFLKKKTAPVLVIDHHKTSDSLGDVELVDSSAAAASLIVLELFKFARWPITPKIAQALFVGVTTDTGWFHFNNTSAAVFRACAELTEAGVNPSQIYHNVFQTFSPQRFRLMAEMLSTLEIHFDGRFASQHLTQQDFKTTGAKYEDTENLIDFCQLIASVEVAALFVESPDGRIRCSLRSRGHVDVCSIAQKFAGGGHKSAAGAYLPGPVENAKKTILDLVRQQLNPI
jgi:phosphoesterase RecJ-like protein